MDCVNVKLDKDIHPVWIEERLMIKDCVNVSCDPEQRSAVVLIGPNIVEVSLLNDILSDEQATDPDTQVINAAEFRLV